MKGGRGSWIYGGGGEEGVPRISYGCYDYDSYVNHNLLSVITMPMSRSASWE